MIMSDRFISPVLIEKLGHKLLEIRERALFSIISKLEHGFVYDNDLARCKEILVKLFEWFLFEHCTYQEDVLNLLKRILQSESGTILINHYGAKTIELEIRQIRSYVEPRLYSVIDEMLALIQQPQQVHKNVPPLQSDVPLSYRSQETCPTNAYTCTIESTATPNVGYVQHEASLEQQAGYRSATCQSIDDQILSNGNPSCLPFILKWQPLVAPDRHVMESVTQSLRSPAEPATLLHSCEFFIEVMLQDFPAEVFLQRPTIVFLFHDYLKSSTSTRLTNSILHCLNKLTKYIITRIYYYSDPCTYNSKQTISTQICSANSMTTSVTATERPYLQNTLSHSPSYNSDEDEDSALLKTKQLSIPHYCCTTMLCILDCIHKKCNSLKDNRTKKKENQVGANLCLALLDELICLLSLCLKPNAWDKWSIPPFTDVLHKFESVLVKFSDVLEHYRLEVMSNNFDKSDRAMHLHLLHSCSDLLTKLVPITRVEFVLPRSMKNVLANVLLDSALARLYPKLHETIFQFVKEFGGRFETDAVSKFKQVQVVCASSTAAIKLLQNTKQLSASAALNLAKEAVQSLEFHKNLSFITIFISICANKLPLQTAQEDLFIISEEVLLFLLAHSDPEISEETYKLCHKRIITTIGPSFNTSGAVALGSQIMFLLKASVLIEICLHGVAHENKQVQKYSEEILIHILKCKILVSEEIWNQIVQALIPILPILACYAGKNSTLGRAVISTLDPDIAKNLNIPLIEVVKGNLRFLFVNDALAQEEALSRLCWLMGLQEDARNLLPRLNKLQDKALGAVCQLLRVNDVNKIKSSHHFYQTSALCQVLELLNSEGVEPIIRRSALTQISVMLEDPLLHHTFFERNGIEAIVAIMKSSLTENDYRDYIDCIIPTVSVLKNVCLYNMSARHELCNNLNVYFYILRGLFMFCSEDRMRQDCNILLCLFLFHDYILGSPAKMDFSVPALIKERLTLPFTCNIHWHTSKNTAPSLAATLLSDKWCLSSIQIHWNSEWFGGFREILKWEKVQYSEADLTQFSKQLRLMDVDLLALKNSSLGQCLSRCLNDIQNGTSHDDVIKKVGKLQCYINLYTLAKDDFEVEKKDLLAFPWENTFSRFLNAPPANKENMLLLITVVKFLAELVPLYTSTDEACWIIAILKNPLHCLPNLLQIELLPELELKLLHQELLHLITMCVLHEQNHLNLHLPNTDELPTGSWLHIIEIISDNLKFNDSQHFYNLAYLDAVLSSLVHLTTALGWSQSKAGEVPKEPIPGLILVLCELVGAFHCGKGHSAASSLMGLSITRYVLLVLNHLLSEMQFFNVKGWEMCFIGESAVEENVLRSLCTLWLSRDVVLRAAILQLLAGLAMSSRAAIELVQELKDDESSKGIWETALDILLDHEEASIVRENAAALLGNLASHTTHSSVGNLALIPNLTPITANKNDAVINAILKLLNELNFYREISEILPCLYVKSSFSYNVNEPTSSSETPSPVSDRDEFTYAYTKNIMSELMMQPVSVQNSANSVTLVTPSFVKALSIFLHNLIILAEEEVASSLQEHGLIKVFFRCLSRPPTKIDSTKELSLYCDILQMNAAVCSLLSKAVDSNQLCLGTVLHTRDCLNVMLSLLNPSLYYINFPQLVYLRNKLWTEAFGLIGALLDSGLHKNEPKSNVQALSIVSSVLSESGCEAFLQSLCEAISFSSSSDLQQSALISLTSLLRAENNSKAPIAGSVQNLLDTVRTPRTSSVEENMREDVENVEPEPNEKDKFVEILWEKKPKSSSNVYFGKVNSKINEMNKKKRQSAIKINRKPQLVAENGPLMAGAELCRILLHLYDVCSIKSKGGKNNKKKTVVISTLTSILCVSREAKRLALQNGLVEIVIQQLKEVHVKLSLESVDCMRRISDKKRVNPVLKELNNLVGLITNFMLGDESVKCTAATLGLADVVHKLWLWFCVDRALLTDALKMLCTFTTDCYSACHSFPLTSSVIGAGPRKIPSNLSLVHEIVGLIYKEMELLSRTHDLNVLKLVFHLLHNSCAVAECRNVLTKTNLLQCLSRLHPALTKRQKPWENVELIWLEFLLTFTAHPEGQVCVAKTADAMELIMMLTSSTKMSNRKEALLVLRNIAFHQPNRPRLLNCDDFLNIMYTKLSSGSIDEKKTVATIMWALAANNQRAKLILKCIGLDAKLQECIKQLNLSPDDTVDVEDVNMMHNVLGVLKGGEKSK